MSAAPSPTKQTNAKQPANTHDRQVVTPTVLQMEAAECGAAALGMVLAYYGRIVPLEQLRVECGVSRDGSKAANLLRVARKYGLDARGFKREPGQLRDDALPMIVFWNFNHFVVVEGFRRGHVLLNDPAAGRRRVTEEEFDRSFTGVALLFTKGVEFQVGGEAPSLVRALSRRLRGSRRALLYVVLVGLCLVVPGIVIPTFSRIFIDNVLIARAESWLRPLLIAMLLTGVFRAGATWLQQRALLRLEMKLSVGTSSEFFWHVLRLPVSFFSQRSGGEIGTRVAINDKVAQLLSGELASTVVSMLTLLFFVLVMFEYDVTLTLVALVAAALDLVALKYVSRKRVDTNRMLLQDRGKMLGTTMSGIQMIETLKGGGSESEFFVRWSGYLAKAMNGEQRLGVSTQVLSAIPPFLAALSTLAILSIGSLRVMNGQLSIGMLLAFLFLATSFMEPITRLVRLGTVVQEIEGGMQRLDDVLSYPQDPLLASYASSVPDDTAASLRWSGHLELRNVTFGYNPLDPPLIENFSLTVRPGQRVALVGMSGSGKSTVSKLVAGLYEPWAGEILFDGKPRTSFPRNVVSNSLAMVDQDIFLFQGSIRDNVTMWDTTLPEATLVRAAKDARVHDDITARPRGYDGVVDESGRNFSGGQRQRLEIARALVLDPAILVLDEATSALDPQTEKELDQQLRQRGCSCLIVAHRLSTIRDCDEIIVLDRGKVVQRGTHDEMKDVEGAYAALIAS